MLSEKSYKRKLMAAFKLQGKVVFQGLKIAIENKKGSIRSGKEPNGKPWSIKMPYDYGYIMGTKGADGDEVDVFIGPDKKAKYVYIVHQTKTEKDQTHDEDKCMLGFKSADAAKEAYHSAYNNVNLFRSMTMLPIEEFKKKCVLGKAKIHAHAELFAITVDNITKALATSFIKAGGPGSGRHAGLGLSKEEQLAEQRKFKQLERDELKKQGKSARGKPIVSEKAQRALANANVATKEHHDLAEANEHTINKSLKGSEKSKDNSPFDIIHTVNGKKHGIEVKALLTQKNDKITQKADAIGRKMAYAKKNKIKSYSTIAVDYRTNPGNPTVYHREGVGSFRLAGMTKVPNGFKGLKNFYK